jgi:NAD-reducing hydrogenase large subunit
MSKAVDSVAKTYINARGNGSGDPAVAEGLLNRVEAAVRAHDPCLSCSTHAIGQMPMIVEMLDPAGDLLTRLQRD